MNESRTLMWGGFWLIIIVVAGTALFQLAILTVYHEKLADNCEIANALVEAQCLQRGEAWLLRWPQDYAVPMIVFGGVGVVLIFVGLITSIEPHVPLATIHHPKTLHDHIGSEHGFLLSDEHHLR